MRKILLFFGLICFISSLNAQVVKTLNLSAGELLEKLTDEEKITITDLTLTGTIDARDFKTMRDEMPKLLNIDLNEASIVSYSGGSGTDRYASTATYAANVVPVYALNDVYPFENEILKSVILPKTVTAIGMSAFMDCRNLEQIIIPESVRRIGDNAFTNCYHIKEINIPAKVYELFASSFGGIGGNINVDVNNKDFSSIDGVLFNKDSSQLIKCPANKRGKYVVPDKVSQIGYSAFQFCSLLEEIVLHNKITFINLNAFANCENLKIVKLPSSIDILTTGLFSYDINLKVVEIPDNVSIIQSNVFLGCENLDSVYIPAKINTIGSMAFVGTKCFVTVDKANDVFSNLDGDLYNKSQTLLIYASQKDGIFKMPDSVVTIGENAFNQRSGVTEVIFSKSLKTIQSMAFSNCPDLERINLPEGLESIDQYAFSSCCSVKSIVLPASLNKLGESSIPNCHSLTEIYSYRKEPLDLSKYSNFFGIIDKTTCLLYVPGGCVEAYSEALNWREFYNIIEMPYLDVSVDSLFINKSEGSLAQLVVNSNAYWTVKVDQDWLTIEPLSGNSTDTVKFISSLNPLAEQRMANVEIRVNDNIYQVVKVYQEANPFLIPDNNVFLFDGSKPENDTAYVTSNVDWRYNWESKWLSVTKPETNPTSLIFSVEKNPTITQRETSVVLSGEKVEDKIITIRQTPGDTIFDVSKLEVFLNYVEGSTDTIELHANIGWSITNDLEWLTIDDELGDEDAALILTATENSGIDRRFGTIFITTDNNDTLFVEVNQKPEPQMIIGADSVFLAKTDGSLVAISMYANVQWQVTTDASWLTVNPLSGASSDTIVIVTSENPFITKRKAELVFSAVGVESQIIYVTQAEGDPRFIVTDSLIIFDAFENTDSISISANIPWVISGNKNWLSISPTEGEMDANVVVNAKQNYKPADREELISIAGNGETRNIRVVQKACDPSLFADVEEVFVSALEGSTGSFNISSTLEWTAQCNSTWLSLSAENGEGDRSITLIAQENPKDTVRTAVITLKADSVDEVQIEVHQYEKKILEVSVDTVWIAGNELGNGVFKIISNEKWTLKSNQSWLSIDSENGTGGHEVAVTGTENPTLQKRSAIITVTSESLLEKQIVVVQGKGNLVFSVSDSILSVAAEDGSTVSFDISTNDTWTIESGQNWLSFDENSGNGTSVITVTVSENFEVESREAVFTVKCSEGKTQNIVLVQDGGKPVLQVEENDLFIEFFDGSSTAFEILSNISWTIVSEVEWLSFDILQGTGIDSLTITAQENKSKTNREATFEVVAEDMDTVIVHIIQGGLPYLQVNIDSIYVSSNENSFVAFEVNSNTKWTISSQEDWLSFNPSQGNGDKVVYVNVESNNNHMGRVSIIEVVANYVDNVNVLFIQSGSELQFSLSDSAFVVGADGSTQSLAINSNANWTIENIPNWISVETKNGTGSDSISFAIDENKSVNARDASILVKVDAKNFKQVIISQSGAEPYLLLNETTFLLTDLQGSSCVVNIKSNTNWSITNTFDWLNVEPANGQGDASVTITANKNEAKEARTASLDFNAEGVELISVKIEQAANSGVGVDDVLDASFMVYPNPVKEGFTVNGINGMKQLCIYNLEGKLLLTETVTDKTFISCPQLTKGVYIIRLEGREDEIKLIKD